MKILEKQMTFPEVQEYLRTHKKYRLPNISSIVTDGIVHPVFHSKTKVDSTGVVDVVNVYVPVLETDVKSSILVKYRVALQYSKEFLETKDKCIEHIKQADPMDTGTILLKRIIEEYL